MGSQVAAATALPLLLGAVIGNALDRNLGSAPWGTLGAILAGLVVAGGGVFALLRRYLAAHPVGAVSDEARAAARRWEAEIAEAERRREEERE